MGDPVKDSRFSHLASDPRFKTIPRSQRQVKIDKRFRGMFEDDRFKVKYTIDKRGRPVSRTSTEDLERYYALSSASSDSEIDAPDGDTGPSKRHDVVLKDKEVVSNDSDAEEDSASEPNDKSDHTLEENESDEDSDEQDDEKVRSDDEQITDRIKSKLHDMTIDYARGEGALLSDSSSDEESSNDEEDVTVEHGWGELDKDAERTDEVTSRLAVCNMDWDRIRAVDLMVLLSSFTPPGGLVRSVSIYPSQFGLERMKREEEEGPPELVENSSKNNKQNEEDDSSSSEDHSVVHEENEEGTSYHMEKLRQYQLNRLKYFYAIVECDSSSTANHIYTECDGMEYESSATRLDLRFVPDDTTFDEEPRERCSEMPESRKYNPRHFTTTALQQAKVQLTWDETDPTRTEITNRLMSGETVDENDLQAYLASSSEEEASEDEKRSNSLTGKKNNEISKKNKKKTIVADDLKSKEISDSGNDGDSCESDGADDSIAKYRALLNGIEEDEKEKKNKDVHLEISWGVGLKEKTEEAVKKRLAKSKELTPFQEMMEKRKQNRKEKKQLKLQKKTQSDGGENDLISDDDIPSDIDMNDPYFAEEFKGMKENPKKKKAKCKQRGKADETVEELQQKAELELLLLEKDNSKHFNFKKIQEEASSNQSKRKKKALRKKEKEHQPDDTKDDFKMNVEDNRFSAVFTSHHYNIDPTDPHFRKSNGMEALISVKQKRIADISDHNPNLPPSKKSKKDAELSLLVKSIKNKALTKR